MTPKKEPPTQLTKYLLTINGFAMQDGRRIRTSEPQRLLAYRIEEKSYKTGVEELQKQGLNDTRIYGKANLTCAETKERQIIDVVEYVHVGYTLRLPALSSKYLKAITSGFDVGTALPTDRDGNESAEPWSNDPKDCPVPVVAPMRNKSSSGGRFCVLLRPEGGYRWPYIVSLSYVFFLPVFRETVAEAHSKIWVSRMMASTFTAEPGSSQLQTPFKLKQSNNSLASVKDITQPTCEEPSNMITIDDLLHHRDVAEQDKPVKALLRNIKDGYTSPQVIVRELHSKYGSGRVDNAGEYEKFARALKNSWDAPDEFLRHITPNNLCKIYRVLGTRGPLILPNLLLPFLVESCRRVANCKQEGNTDEEAGEVKDILDDVMSGMILQYMWKATKPVVAKAERDRCLTPIVKYLATILNEKDDLDLSKMNTSAGTASVVPVDAWSTYCNLLDTTLRKDAFETVVQKSLAESNGRTLMMKQMIVDLRKYLQQMIDEESAAMEIQEAVSRKRKRAEETSGNSKGRRSTSEPERSAATENDAQYISD